MTRSLTDGWLTLAQDSAPEALRDMSLLDYIHAGGFLSYVLVLISFVALTLVIRNVIVLRLPRLAPPEIVRRLDQLLRENDMRVVQQFCAAPDHRCFITNIFGSAVGRCLKSPFGLLEFRSAMEESGQAEVDRLHRLNDGIGIIAAIGPMLGLLGTVIGMIGAFRTIGELEGAARSNELAKFMSLALINTAEGLVVAIPCTVIFAVFRRRIDELVARAGQVTEDLAGHLASSAGAEPGVAPKPAPRARPAGAATA